MPIAIALVLLLAQPPGEAVGESESEPAPGQPVEVEGPSEGEPPPLHIEPPPPGISGPPPAIELAPPREVPTQNVPPPPEPEPDPDSEFDPDHLIRDPADLPLAPTAARKSAVRRSNEVLVRPFRRPVYSVTAAGRFGTLFSDGAQLVQPFGYGFAAALRIHFLPVAKSRFGVEVHAGHTRWPKRIDFMDVDGDKVARKALLTDTDFSAGPSLEIPIGPLFFGFGGSAGVAISSLYRPVSIDSVEDKLDSATNFMLRGGLNVGIPLLKHHGLNIGSGVHHVFSRHRVAIDPTVLENPQTVRPFGTWLEVSLGYQIWF